MSGILELCHVLVRDQSDVGVGMSGGGPGGGRAYRQGDGVTEMEQGWVARIIHLMKADSLDTQNELLQTARRYFVEGGERMRYTYPPLIIAFIHLARRYKPKLTEVSRTSMMPGLVHYVSSLF